MKEDNYIVILQPMVEKLKLSGNSLLIFALIHGFSQDGNNEFTGSLNYLCKWFGLTKNSAMAVLKKLTDAGLIDKREYYNNGVKFCAYRSNYRYCIENLDSGAKIAIPSQKFGQGGAKIAMGGGAKIAPNNTNIDNTNYIDSKSKSESDDSSHNSPQQVEILSPYETECTSIVLKEKGKGVARARNRSLEEREQDFYNSLIPHLAEYGNDMIRDFFNYWSEPNQQKTKMKFELQKTWAIKGRLATWSKNQSKFENNGFKTKRQQHEEDLLRLAEDVRQSEIRARSLTREQELAKYNDIPI